MQALARRIGATGAARHWPLRLGTPLALGALMALGQAPVGLPLVLFAALPGLLWLLDAAPDARAAFRLGWLAGTGFFAAALFWIVEPFLVDPARTGWMAPFALVLVAGGLALFWAVPFAAANALTRRLGAGDRVARVVLLVGLWMLSDYARSHVLTGFPWALPAYVWVETPVMQVSALVGPHGLGALTLFAGLLPGAAPLRGGITAALLVGLGWGYGSIELAQPLPARAEPLTVRLVQPNAAQHLKWRPEMQQAFYQRHLAATRAPADPMPDVTIWSETAVPFVLGFAEDLQAEMAAAVGPEGRLILGIQRLGENPDRNDWYNSLAVLEPDGRAYAVYDKHHLVPFGEYIPFAGAIARLGLPALTAMTGGGFRSGPGPRLMEVPGLPTFLPLICYEAIFPHEMQPPGGRPEWIVQITNDAWFGTLSGPYQHFAQARARAIEQGLPLARAANPGITAMIDPRGRVVAELGLGETGYIDAALPAALPAPLYARTGDWPVLILVLLALGLTVAAFSSGILAKPRS